MLIKKIIISLVLMSNIFAVDVKWGTASQLSLPLEETNTPIPDVVTTQSPQLKVVLTKIAAGSPRLGNLEKITRTNNLNGSVTVRSCAKFKRSNTDSKYIIYGVVRTPANTFGTKVRISKKAPCFSFTAKTPGKYEAYYELYQTRKNPLDSKRLVFNASY